MLATPVFDTFDDPLDPALWYVGAGAAPRKGALRLAKGAWLAGRVPAEGVTRIEVVFRRRGGRLELTRHSESEPLTRPSGKPFVVAKGKGEQTLVWTGDGVTVDGEAVAAELGAPGPFRLRALKGAVEMLEVRVGPRHEAAEWGALEKATVFGPTTPRVYHDGKREYRRTTLMLWDAEVAVLVVRADGADEFAALRAPVKGAPALGALVVVGDGKARVRAVGGAALSMRDWGDEKGNLDPAAYAAYLGREYRTFAVLHAAQRALNLAAEGLDDEDKAEALVHLAAIRHTPNAHAAIALAEAAGAKLALAELRKCLPGRAEFGRASADALRRAAGEAARSILGKEPPFWPAFSFTPMSRFVAVQRAEELAR